MKLRKEKDSKAEYKKIVKMVERARKAADKFIQANKHLWDQTATPNIYR